MYGKRVSIRERAGAGALTAALVATIGWMLVAGLADAWRPAKEAALATFDVVTPLPSPAMRVVPRQDASRRPQGRAAPAGARSQATDVVAPPPVLPLSLPPVIAAPVAGTGAAATQGAAEWPGPEPGAGGIGDGRGSGGAGDGDGGGQEREPRWLRGRLSFADGARVAGEAVIGRSISARCTLEVTGRLTGCTVARSTGIAALDEAVCRLIERRFRYTPWLDRDGRPVESTILIDQGWYEEE